MERFIFWLKRRFYRKDHLCRCFCVTCEHYEKCKGEIVLSWKTDFQ